MKQNQMRPETLGAPRNGCALLCGLVFCGRCRWRMEVSYRNRDKPYYRCVRHLAEGTESPCFGVSADVLDELVSQQVLRALEPAALELSMQAQADVEQEHERLDRPGLAAEAATCPLWRRSRRATLSDGGPGESPGRHDVGMPVGRCPAPGVSDPRRLRPVRAADVPLARAGRNPNASPRSHLTCPLSGIRRSRRTRIARRSFAAWSSAWSSKGDATASMSPLRFTGQEVTRATWSSLDRFAPTSN